ncbi:ParM/StbA family protein [Endozoicomonas sp. G2_2]|uniref:ParM/StbA family protein n=1 Tax=Endozoicomonas sp. G2_2 TaxID=2821092 RepID=UPI001ADC9C40|nr:ParM/StbA family protein [Endozoicomonas sp. G2_2]MBO9471726.1 ParM/StbA family protein [Endozoicomonas sp. G2_2]
MTQTVNAGIDIGYGAVKVVASERAPFSFPAYTARIEDVQMLPPDMKRRVITLDGINYLVGDDARKVRRVTETYVDSDRIHQNEYRLLGLHALRMLDAERVNLTAGLPVRDYTRHREALAEIVRSWNGVYCKVALHKVVPQPFGTFWDIGLNLDPVETKQFEHGKVAIIDIGSGTTDLIEVNENQFNPASYTTDPFAVSIAMKLIRNQIQVKHNAEFDITAIPKIAADGEFMSKGKPLSVARIVSEAKRHVVINTLAVAQRLWGSLNTFRYVVVTGGGAQFLREELEQYIPSEQLMIPTDPEFSNARGFLAATLKTS